MVWFYRRADCYVSGLVCSFQSHYGLILSEFGLAAAAGVLIFQSHYGLILSFDYFKTKFLEKAPFNPTMVWFYQTSKIRDV